MLENSPVLLAAPSREASISINKAPSETPALLFTVPTKTASPILTTTTLPLSAATSSIPSRCINLDRVSITSPTTSYLIVTIGGKMSCWGKESKGRHLCLPWINHRGRDSTPTIRAVELEFWDRISLRPYSRTSLIIYSSIDRPSSKRKIDCSKSPEREMIFLKNLSTYRYKFCHTETQADSFQVRPSQARWKSLRSHSWVESPKEVNEAQW